MKYIMKPVIIEAIQYDGTNLGKISRLFPDIEYYSPALPDSYIEIFTFSSNYTGDDDSRIEKIASKERGRIRVNPGDYIIKGNNGRYFSYKADVFKSKYVEYKKGKKYAGDPC